MTAINVMMVEPGVSPGTTAREMMPGGVALSATLHVAVFVIILVGLPSLFHHPPPQETPIAVELVTIAPETRATQPNPFRPKPEAKPDPAVAAPAPKPEPKPEPPQPTPEPPASASTPPLPAPPEPAKPEAKAPPPPPPPPPKPVEAQAPPPPPPRHPEPKPKPEPQQASHAPRADKADPKAFDKLLKNLEQKPEPAAFDSLLKNLTRQQVAQADDAPPAPHRIAATAPPSSQPKAPLGSQLTASELDALREAVRQQLMPCWNVPAGVRDARDLIVEVRAAVSQDGTVRQATIVDQGRLGDPLFRAAAESARRTFFNPSCTPLKLPADKYEVWRDLVVGFNPKDIL